MVGFHERGPKGSSKQGRGSEQGLVGCGGKLRVECAVGVIHAVRGAKMRKRRAFGITGCHRPDGLVLRILGRDGLACVDKGVPGLEG